MNMPDLTIIPQAGIIIPGKHLDELDTKRAKADWAAYGNEQRPTTSTLEIPQTARLHAVAGCASTPQHAPVVRTLALVA